MMYTNTQKVTKFITISLCVVLLFSCQPRKVATNLNQNIDQYIKQLQLRQGIPGVSLAVVKGGQVIHKQNYGLASIEHNVAISQESIFRVYSLILKG